MAVSPNEVRDIVDATAAVLDDVEGFALESGQSVVSEEVIIGVTTGLLAAGNSDLLASELSALSDGSFPGVESDNPDELRALYIGAVMSHYILASTINEEEKA